MVRTLRLLSGEAQGREMIPQKFKNRTSREFGHFLVGILSSSLVLSGGEKIWVKFEFCHAYIIPPISRTVKSTMRRIRSAKPRPFTHASTL